MTIYNIGFHKTNVKILISTSIFDVVRIHSTSIFKNWCWWHVNLSLFYFFFFVSHIDWSHHWLTFSDFSFQTHLDNHENQLMQLTSFISSPTFIECDLYRWWCLFSRNEIHDNNNVFFPDLRSTLAYVPPLLPQHCQQLQSHLWPSATLL